MSFLSLSGPVNNRLALGFSLHRFLNYEETVNLESRAIPDTTLFYRPVNGSVDFSGTSFGGSAAYRVTDALRVGVTVAGNRLKADSVATRSSAFVSNFVASESSIHDTQTAISASLGVIYRANDKVSLGFNYARAPRFKTKENLTVNVGGTLTQDPAFPKDVEINVPDHFGFGVAVNPTSRLLVAFDAVRTNYSSLSENTTVVFFPASVKPTDFDANDVTELHFGAEYNVYSVKGNPLFVRAGVFTNPNHLVNFTGTAAPGASLSTQSDIAVQQAQYNLLPRKDDTRGTVGAGLTLGRRTQIDVAYVFGKEFVASTAFRF